MTGTTVLEGGRRKALRPLPASARRAAFEAGVAAYERRDFFLAHELLEPAWMGSDDPAERALDQGLIKLAAAGVHAVRGNRQGLVKNLAGARERLARASGRPTGVIESGLDLPELIVAIDAHIAAATAATTGEVPDPPRLPRPGLIDGS